MNKRQYAKTNKKKILSILKNLKPEFKATSIRFGNGYFIFSIGKGKNTVCHFEFKQIPDWKWGIWNNGNGSLSFFGEHDLLIDKFKPSRTYVSIEIEDEDDIENVLLPELRDIKTNAKLHFICSATYTDPEQVVDVDKQYAELIEEYQNDKMD